MNPATIGCVWTGEFDLPRNTLRVDGEIFESGKKKLRIKNIRIRVDGALEVEESRSKYNRSNPAGSSHETELQSELEDNSCKDI